MTSTTPVATGLHVRTAALDFLTSDRLAATLTDLRRSGAAGADITDAIPRTVADAVQKDMRQDPGWQQEYWLFDEKAQVHPVDPAVFFSSPHTARFSRNACLRRPSKASMSLRGLLSAVVSAQALDALSAVYGRTLRFASADIAAYRRGDYLRRHADTFDDRCFGLVWFLSNPDTTGSGGELVVEAPTGEGLVIAPRAGSVGVIPINPSYTHLVSRIQQDWIRYSIATHYALDTRNPA
ncbi:2OG-Fe(II) oxygenase [Streptomyces sp. IBSBF 3136]|uniref:2OG-Fe(II) oxygenase n=1 Tax=Streptomyces sp. IBSBF 3136 TaxID=2903524 RepID=UPI002FDC37C8